MVISICTSMVLFLLFFIPQYLVNGIVSMWNAEKWQIKHIKIQLKIDALGRALSLKSNTHVINSHNMAIILLFFFIDKLQYRRVPFYCNFFFYIGSKCHYVYLSSGDVIKFWMMCKTTNVVGLDDNDVQKIPCVLFWKRQLINFKCHEPFDVLNVDFEYITFRSRYYTL